MCTYNMYKNVYKRKKVRYTIYNERTAELIRLKIGSEVAYN